jgi:hypothetical protein
MFDPLRILELRDNCITSYDNEKIVKLPITEKCSMIWVLNFPIVLNAEMYH